MQNKKGDDPVFLITRKHLHNHISVELKRIHCGSLFEKHWKLFIRREVWFVLCVWYDKNKIIYEGPELDQPNCTLSYAPERNTEFKCELCLHFHACVESVLLLFNWQVKTLSYKLMEWLISLKFELRPFKKKRLCTKVGLKKIRKVTFLHCLRLVRGYNLPLV